MLPHQRSPPHYWLLQHVASLKTYREYMRFMAPTKSKLTFFSNLECKYEANCGSTISILKERKGPIRTNQLKGREWSHNLGRALWTLFDGLLWGSAYDTKRGLVSALHFGSKATCMKKVCHTLSCQLSGLRKDAQLDIFLLSSTYKVSYQDHKTYWGSFSGSCEFS